MDLRPTLGSALDAFGVDATVTVPGGSPVSTRVIWLPPITNENPPGSGLRRVESKRVLALPASAVPAAPRGTIVNAPELPGGPSANWRVDEGEKVAADEYRVIVVPA